MAREEFRHLLSRLIRARFPILSITTSEESRVLAEIEVSCAALSPAREVYLWSTSSGFGRAGQGGSMDTRTPHAALQAAAKLTAPAVVVLLDVHPWLGSAGAAPDTQLVRALKDVARPGRGGVPLTLVLVSAVAVLPPELGSSVTLVDFPLPDEAYLRTLLERMLKHNASGIRIELSDDGLERMAKAALGLSAVEAENAFARALVDDDVLTDSDIAIVAEEKKQVIRKSGVLEAVTSTVKLEDVGGLGNLKTWLTKRNGSWLDEARSYGLPAPKGVLVTGVPGCGKSLTAKAMASAWELPLIRLDIGRIFGGLVGASEQNIRTALATAEATAPCVLWIDEIEKGFAAGASGQGDSGTSARVFGTFLTWMQEKRSAVFVMATANDISLLPPEFLRKGRFDEIFFIDLPTLTERRVIFQIHLAARLAAGPALGSLAVTDELLEELATATEGFTGAEVENVVVVACFEAFDGRRALTIEDLRRGIEHTVPLSVTQAESIARLRAWADVRAVAASAPQDRLGYAVSEDAGLAVDEAAIRARGGRAVEA